MPKTKVNLIGAGHVGKTLLRLLSSVPNCELQDVLSARQISAREAVEFAGAGRAVGSYSDLRPADLWILAVPDAQIAKVAAKITAVFDPVHTDVPAPVAFHCSGFFAADQLAPLKTLGWHLASVHPVLSFADPMEAAQQFKNTYCGMEGDESALKAIKPILSALGAISFDIQSDSKSLYHAAAVISNNFTVVLQAIAREAWAAAGVPDDIAEALNSKLLHATHENVIAKGPRDALTGPAARGDTLVVEQQGQDVTRWHPSAGLIYEEMSKLAHRLKSNGTTGE